MKPYKNITTQNLSMVLLIARVMAWTGWFLFAVILLGFLPKLFVSIDGFSISSMGIYIAAPVPLIILTLSGLLAALVAFEENYRIRTHAKLEWLALKKATITDADFQPSSTNEPR